jgi:hypothetical protein
MAEGCTFVASPFKPSHCKLCFQAKVDHKIPVVFFFSLDDWNLTNLVAQRS